MKQGYSEVFIADTGTAVAALAVGWHMADPPRQAKYLEAMQKYHLFVTEGCKTAPTNPPVGTAECPPTGTGWVHTSGKDKGALGDGWYLLRRKHSTCHANPSVYRCL